MFGNLEILRRAVAGGLCEKVRARPFWADAIRICSVAGVRCALN